VPDASAAFDEESTFQSTLVIDVPTEIGLQRIRQRASDLPDRMERENITFYNKVREGYLLLAQQWPERVVVIAFYRCRLESGTIAPRESQAMAWVARDRLTEFEFPPADAELIARLAAGR